MARSRLLLDYPKRADVDISFLRFRQECKAGGKQLMVWTVNEPSHMMEVCAFHIYGSVSKPYLTSRGSGCPMGC